MRSLAEAPYAANGSAKHVAFYSGCKGMPDAGEALVGDQRAGERGRCLGQRCADADQRQAGQLERVLEDRAQAHRRLRASLSQRLRHLCAEISRVRAVRAGAPPAAGGHNASAFAT